MASRIHRVDDDARPIRSIHEPVHRIANLRVAETGHREALGDEQHGLPPRQFAHGGNDIRDAIERVDRKMLLAVALGGAWQQLEGVLERVECARRARVPQREAQAVDRSSGRLNVNGQLVPRVPLVVTTVTRSSGCSAPSTKRCRLVRVR